MKNKSKGFTLVEVIVVLVILAILAAIMVPSYINYIKNANAKVCLVNRSQIIRYHDLYELAYGGEYGFERYVGENYGDMADMCPEGGTYTVHESLEGGVFVTCSVHNGSNKFTLTHSTTSSGLLTNANQLYNAATGLFADMLSQYSGFSVGSKKFVSLNGQDLAYDYSTNPNTEIPLSSLLLERLDTGTSSVKELFSDVKIYYKLDGNGKPTSEVWYVYVKKGNTWVKYAADATETGVGSATPSEPPKTQP